MNFTEMNKQDGTYFGYLSKQVETGVSFEVWLQVDRATSSPVWWQIWQEIGMKIHEEIICGKRMLRKR